VLLGGLLPAVLLEGRTGSAADVVLGEPAPPGPGITCRAQLESLGCEELLQVFASGCGGSTPVGLGKGTVLLLVNTKHARMKARMNNLVWKGKRFEEDGTFINQWACFKALRFSPSEGPSWFDGRPCIILDYTPGTPVFGNTRDEIREVGPGLWLGMFYDKEPCPKLRGFFCLECPPDKHPKCGR
jgi:hypothetical protein